MALLFSGTLFVSAVLLMLVQPMTGKMLLPLLGGTPAIWNTCMVFFQAALLAGYAYAHAAPRWLGPRGQLALHAVVLALPLLVLPIGASLDQAQPPTSDNPVLWLLGTLALVVGVPFFVVSTSAPLLQHWFSTSDHAAAKDPYFLYAASNAGSMLALLGYPLLVEPWLAVDEQAGAWALAYGVLALLTLGCIAWAMKRRQPAAPLEAAEAPPEPLRWRVMLHWVALAFVPSSLMLGVTTFFTTDIAAIPLFWVLPFALYLLSFIIVFSRRRPISHETLRRLAPVAILALVFVMLSSGTHQLRTGVLMAVHLAVLFLASTLCHGELALRRPAPRHLTAFFLCMSVGGVLGGLFNALLAPVAFTHVIEYPIALVMLCLLLPRSTGERVGWSWGDLLWPVGVGGAAAFLILEVLGGDDSRNNAWPILQALPAALGAMLVYLVPLFVCFAASSRPLRFGLCVAALFAAKFACQDPHGRVLHRERGFYGDLHVRVDATGRFMQMFHGTTLHGMQATAPEDRRKALTYFHETGPIGDLFATLKGDRAPRKVAVTGLGVGVLMGYAEPGQHWTYYEIDPAVVRVARDTRYFTYLDDAEKRGVKLDMVIGDARLRMADAPAGGYDWIFLDVFSSDSVPVHLLTTEALRLYESKWAPGGLMVFNISSRYLDLEPVLGALAKELGLAGVVKHDRDVYDLEEKRASAWVVLARTPADLAPLSTRSGWNPLQPTPGTPPWTDRYSNILKTLMLWR